MSNEPQNEGERCHCGKVVELHTDVELRKCHPEIWANPTPTTEQKERIVAAAIAFSQAKTRYHIAIFQELAKVSKRYIFSNRLSRAQAAVQKQQRAVSQATVTLLAAVAALYEDAETPNPTTGLTPDELKQVEAALFGGL